MSLSWCRLGRGGGAGEYYLSEMKKENGGEDQASYYLGAAAPAGAWWTPGGTLVPDGSRVQPDILRTALAGFDPNSGAALVQRAGEKHLAGFDMTLSAPKSVSTLWACGDGALRTEIEAAQTTAVLRAYEFMQEQGLFITRAGKDGAIKLETRDVQIARFRHSTSRAGDPQIHDHGVILNVCVGADGKTRTLETSEILKFQGAIAAAYRVTLARELQALGFAVEKKDRNFEVVGIDGRIIDRWSKRRTEIEDAAREHKISTKRDRARAQVVALETRGKKSAVPDGAALEKRWSEELASCGISARGVVSAARLMGGAAVEPIDIVAAALGEGTSRESVIERRQLLQLVLEHGQGRITVADSDRLIGEALECGALIRIGTDGIEQAVYTTHALVKMERQMLLDTIERREEPRKILPDAVEAAIAARPSCDGEQAGLVRALASGGGVMVGEGSAGTGKSFTTAMLVEAAEASGLRVRGFAPSWKAAEILRRDSTLEETAALQGFVRRLERGDEGLTARDVVIVDEAGMVGLGDMAALLRHARAAGAQVFLLGDSRQLEAIGPGGPLRLLSDVLGTTRLETVRRQRDTLDAAGKILIDRAWMRTASMALADNRASDALRAYDARDHIVWAEDRDGAVAALLADYEKGFVERPEKTRQVITPRNADVRDLNEKLRAVHRGMGLLTGDDVIVEAVDRGGVARPLALSVGERITFGERVEQYGFNRSDAGTVTAVARDADGMARVTVRLDKDSRAVTARLDELVGWRAPNDTDRTPHIQHGYAGTLYLAQGVTVDEALVLNTEGMAARELYVALTRHRENVRVYIDTERVRDALESRYTADEKPEITIEDIKATVYKEANTIKTKRNIGDYVKDRAEWLRTGVLDIGSRPVAEPPKYSADTSAQALAERMRQRMLSAPPPAPPRDVVAKIRRWLARTPPAVGADGARFGLAPSADARVARSGETLIAVRDPAGVIVGAEGLGGRRIGAPGVAIVGAADQADRIVVCGSTAEAAARRWLAPAGEAGIYVSVGGDRAAAAPSIERLAGGRPIEIAGDMPAVAAALPTAEIRVPAIGWVAALEQVLAEQRAAGEVERGPVLTL